MNLVDNLLTLVNQIKICHWQSETFGSHTALGLTYDKLNDLIDLFIEEFMGKYGKIRSESGFLIKLKNANELDITEFINLNIQYLTTELIKIIQPTDTNLLNIRDEILGELQKLKYLMTLQ